MILEGVLTALVCLSRWVGIHSVYIVDDVSLAGILVGVEGNGHGRLVYAGRKQDSRTGGRV